LVDAIALPELLTEAEAGTRLTLSAATIQRMRRGRKIRHVMIGGRPRYTLAYLAEYITS